ncbi:MAG TPA: isoprenyl transferase [Verrucomicrobiales bacterium]|jgi:undecaprenyl diphosphate synthase|nr:isoprenyl transferase [Verrucomicrobiales bacterium]HAL03810.1 isoprenyl transferase [Verrucomicrobiales bacterium]HBV31819.1 isoprenyl transferase [Verrucomicrobiales bacterium]|tara:strand:+ start:6249 stop:6986 length:738 start_codon:yes stop_codon:yes gene_type:complete
MSGAATQLSDKALAVLPAHVAIIMDGNGRWAKERSLPRVEGHRRGAESVRSVLRTAARLGVKYLTLYAFSVENWKRPQDEVDTLMKYLARYLKSEQREMNDNNVKLQAIGQTSRLPKFVRDQLEATRESLSQNTGTTLTLALSYGGRTELVDAVRGIAEKARDGEIDPAKISEQTISGHLYTSDMPDPDLLIRTSGEMRVSNFLLWQISYAELVVTDRLWPDFGEPEFCAAMEEFAGRNRRFGKV